VAKHRRGRMSIIRVGLGSNYFRTAGTEPKLITGAREKRARATTESSKGKQDPAHRELKRVRVS